MNEWVRQNISSRVFRCLGARVMRKGEMETFPTEQGGLSHVSIVCRTKPRRRRSSASRCLPETSRALSASRRSWRWFGVKANAGR